MTEKDDEIALSAHALAALAEFHAEQDAHQARSDELQAAASDGGPLVMDAFVEDWNESQFWYSHETAHALAGQLLQGSTRHTTIGLVSAPSVFVGLRSMLQSRPEHQRPRLVLLENDERFRLFPQYVFYDYRDPLKLPAEFKASVDRLLCDPPFLSQDCQTKGSALVSFRLGSCSFSSSASSSFFVFLICLKPASPSDGYFKTDKAGQPRPRIIVCTGESMKPLVTRLYLPLGLQPTTFEPKHASGLSNQFSCFTNFESPLWAWQQQGG